MKKNPDVFRFVRKKGVTKEDYKSYNNVLNSLLRESKAEYFAFKFKEAKGNPLKIHGG